VPLGGRNQTSLRTCFEMGVFQNTFQADAAALTIAEKSARIESGLPRHLYQNQPFLTALVNAMSDSCWSAWI
jgi:hypothetical protein